MKDFTSNLNLLTDLLHVSFQEIETTLHRWMKKGFNSLSSERKHVTDMRLLFLKAHFELSTEDLEEIKGRWEIHGCEATHPLLAANSVIAYLQTTDYFSV